MRVHQSKNFIQASPNAPAKMSRGAFKASSAPALHRFRDYSVSSPQEGGVIQRQPIDLKAVLRANKKNKEAVKTIKDAMRVQEILTNPDLFGPALEQLESDVGGNVRSSGTKKALTKALATREQQAGFDPNAPIYTGALSDRAFKESAARGRLFKDVGVSNEHGEYTHRIQWYALHHAMSGGFQKDVSKKAPKGFNFTPTQLLDKINNAGVVIPEELWPQGKEGGGNLWDAIFDRTPMLSPQSAPPESYGLTAPEVANLMLMPKEFTQETARGLDAMFPGTLGKLGKIAPRVGRLAGMRFRKRSGQDKSLYAARKIESRKYHQGDLKGVLEKGPPPPPPPPRQPRATIHYNPNPVPRGVFGAPQRDDLFDL